MYTEYQQLWDAVNYSARAPSSHNAQPWHVSIDAAGIHVSLDSARTTPQADPEHKSAHISLGAFIETLSITLNARGYRYTLQIETEPDVRCTFESIQPAHSDEHDAMVDDLYKAITTRYTYRGVYDQKPIPQTVIDELILAAEDSIQIDCVQDRTAIETVLKITLEGLQHKYQSVAFRREVQKWFRTHLSRKKDGLHSRALRMNALQSILFRAILPLFNPYSVVCKNISTNIRSSRGVVSISAQGDSIADLIAVGRSAQKALLLLNANGIAASIYMAGLSNAALQEKVSSVFDLKTVQPQFIFFIGYPMAEVGDYMTPRLLLSD